MARPARRSPLHRPTERRADNQRRLVPHLPRRRLRHAPPTRHHRRLKPMRRTILAILTALVAVIALGSIAIATSGDNSTVTRPRLERSLTTTFANLYVDQAHLEGRDLTTASLHPRAMCDKAGAENKDIGPGGD